MRECLQCGTAFSPASVIHTFCSDRCRKAARGVDYRAARRLALYRDGYACTECGATGQLDCHHIRPLCQGGSHRLGNLQTLCRPCHHNKHRSWKAYGKAYGYPGGHRAAA